MAPASPLSAAMAAALQVHGAFLRGALIRNVELCGDLECRVSANAGPQHGSIVHVRDRNPDISKAAQFCFLFYEGQLFLDVVLPFQVRGQLASVRCWHVPHRYFESHCASQGGGVLLK